MTEWEFMAEEARQTKGRKMKVQRVFQCCPGACLGTWVVGCCGLNVCMPQNSSIETAVPKAMVLAGGPMGVD